MTNWDYRLVEFEQTDTDPEPYMELCEVRYIDDGAPLTYARAVLNGETINDIAENIDLMLKAFEKNVLYETQFINGEYDYND